MRHFMTVSGIVLVSALVCAALYFTWNPRTPRSTNGKPDPVVYHTNCLPPEDRKVFYHLAEGSEVFPLDWLRAAKRKGTDKLFLEDMGRFGLLPDPDSPDGLPVGITAAPTRGLTSLGKMVGLNCAACHVGQIAYGGKSLRIDGAPNLFDANMFFTELVEAGQGIIASPKELLGFLERLHAQKQQSRGGRLVPRLFAHLAKGESDLKKALLPRIEKLIAEAKAKPSAEWTVKPAPGADDAARKRLLAGTGVEGVSSAVGDAGTQDSPLQGENDDAKKDAIDAAAQEVVVTVRLLKARIEFLKNLAHIGKTKPDWGFGRVDAFGSVRALYFEPDYVPNGPVSYPSIWAFDKNPWFHYDGDTTSVLQRNLGQALGVGAIYEKDSYASTLRPVDSNTLEELSRKIKVPAWPVDLFGPIDADKAKKGKTLFEANCLSCHAAIPPTETAPDLLIDLTVIGTDTQRALGFTANLKATGKPFFEELAVVLDKVTKKSFEDNDIPPDARPAFAHGRKIQWRTEKKYAARPLWGVWATAPYLHNGSVPTLHDLFLPAKDRPKTFPLGHREYDPVKVGYTTPEGKPRFLFDTSKIGNGNGGHEFGTNLGEADRAALIEYLKTL